MFIGLLYYYFLLRCHYFILLFNVPSSLFLVAMAVSGSTQLQQKESPSKRPGPAKTIFWDCFPAAYNLQKYHYNWFGYVCAGLFVSLVKNTYPNLWCFC